MKEELLVNFCSPTLAGIKSAALFTYFSKNKKEVIDLILEWNKLLNKKGIFVESIREREGDSLIYVYRPKMLFEEINAGSSGKYLKSLGYDTEDLEKSIKKLKSRVLEDDFPHEIGLFLGYPYEDVECFINNCGQKELCSGCRKVYKDKMKKEIIFKKYKTIKKSYDILYKSGKKIESLCV